MPSLSNFAHVLNIGAKTSIALFALVAALACEDTGGLSVVAPTLTNVHVTGTNIVEGAVTEPVVRVRFDRPLQPISVLRQSFVLVTNDNRSVEPPVVSYNPILREVAIASPFPAEKPWLEDGGYYRLALGIAATGATAGGVRALDDAPLDAKEPRIFGFVYRKTVQPARTSSDYCRDIQPWFTARCASCHGAEAPVLGLDLHSPSAVARTAIGAIAKETANGPTVGTSEPSATVLAQDLPRIAPGDPSRSYLLYKAFLGERAALAEKGTSDGTLGCPATLFDDRGTLLSAADRAVLSDRIPGASMPFSSDPGNGPTRDELLHLSRWIADGAQTPASCTECR